MLTEEQEQLLLMQQLSLPNLVQLFEIKYKAITLRYCSDFRLSEVWWNSLKWTYLPLTLENFQFSEDNSSAIPSISLLNLAFLYDEAFSAIPSLVGAKVTFYQIFANTIKEHSSDPQSDLYCHKFVFKFSRKLPSDSKTLTYQLDPIGYTVNAFAPSRLILREGLFNMAFPGAGEKWQQ